VKEEDIPEIEGTLSRRRRVIGLRGAKTVFFSFQKKAKKKKAAEKVAEKVAEKLQKSNKKERSVCHVT